MINSGLNFSSAGNQVRSIAARKAGPLVLAASGVGHNVRVAGVGTGAGVVRMLEARTEHHTLIIGKYIFGAIAVMHIKIKNGDAIKLVHFKRVNSADGDVIENTKSH